MTYIQTTSPRTAVFYGESMADLALMPTTTKIGEGEYIHALAQEGSYAIILLTDGLKKFMLRSTGWVEVKDQGSGGSGWFEPGGNTTFAELPTPSEDNVGIVYNITDAFTTDERFNEGAGVNYPAGTNVAIVNVGTDSTPVYKFDTYVGAYTTDDELSLVSENPVQNKVITSEINAINTTLSSLATVATSGSYADLLDKPIVNCTESEYEEIVSELEEGTIVNIYDVHKVVYVGSDSITAILPFWIGTTAELESDLANIPEGFIIIVTDGATQTGVPVNYNLIVNHPTINGVEVVGNKTTVNLGIINDSAASNTATYSSNKIVELIGGGAESKKLYISSQSLDTETSGDFWIQMPDSSTVTALYIYNNDWQKIDNYFYGSQPPAEYSDGVYWVQIFNNVVARVLQYVSGNWTNPSEGHSMFIDSLDIPTKDDLWIKVNSSGGADGLYSYNSGWTLSADLPNTILAEMLATNSINFHSLTGTQYANTISGGGKNICYGQENSLTNCNQYLMGGINNAATGANQGAMFGQWNEDSGYYNLIAGSHNSVGSSGNVVAGSYNTVANSYNVVAGYGHGVGATNGLVCGSYASATDAITVGNGTGTSDRKNSMTVSSTGYVTAAGYTMSGADYAEYFEWKDGNANNEDRRGMLVQLDGDKIVLANGTDINGIVSTKSALCGNAYELYWQGRYKKDEFGEVICDEEGKQVISDDYDPNVEYIPRSQRKEWAPIGLVGQLVVRDNGECKPNDYIAAENGIAVSTENYSKVKCMKRISDTLIRCLISC